MNRLSLIVVASALAACSTELDVETDNPPPPGGTSGSEENTFDHENDGISPWELVDRLIKEGPPRFTSHMHSCAKVKYATLGAVLRSVGVDTASTAALSAGDLYRSGFNAMGGANYANRIRENVGITTSGASRMFDIFAAAAPEVIAAMPNLERCKVDGTPAVLFNASNQCEPSGIACLIGTPPQAAHLELCNQTVTNASSIDVGKRMAVAVMLAAAFSCE